MVLRSLKSRVQLAKAIVSANLRSLEAISILTKADALNFALLLILIDKFQVNTSFCKLASEFFPTICRTQYALNNIVNLVFGTLSIA